MTTVLSPTSITSALRLAIALMDAASLSNGNPNYHHLGFELEASNLYTYSVDGPSALPCAGWIEAEDEDSRPHEYTVPEAEFSRQWREGVVELAAELAWLDSLYSHASRRAIVKTQTARDRFKVSGLPRLVLPGSEPLDPEVIAVGTGERKPRPKRDQLLRAIAVREDAFRGTKTRDEFRDANMARAQIDLGSKYGIGDGSIFGQPGVALNEWDERQLRNWNEWLGSKSRPAVARV